MTLPLPEVDTSLDAGQKTGIGGIDAPGFDAPTFPVATQDEFDQAFPQGTTNFGLHAQTGGGRSAVIEYAKQFLGTPYKWGGTQPGGFDCSGLVQYVWKKFGVNLPRVSQAQANAGKHVGIDQLQAGDLVLFPGSKNNGMAGPGHVALYMGNGQIIEAPYTGARVRVRDLGKKENVFGVQINYRG